MDSTDIDNLLSDIYNLPFITSPYQHANHVGTKVINLKNQNPYIHLITCVQNSHKTMKFKKNHNKTIHTSNVCLLFPIDGLFHSSDKLRTPGKIVCF